MVTVNNTFLLRLMILSKLKNVRGVNGIVQYLGRFYSSNFRDLLDDFLDPAHLPVHQADLDSMRVRG